MSAVVCTATAPAYVMIDGITYPVWKTLVGPIPARTAEVCTAWLPLSQALTTLDTAVSPDVLGITDAALAQAIGGGAALVIGLWVLGLSLGWVKAAIQALYKED